MKTWWPVIEEGVQKLSDKLVDLAGVRSGSKVLDVATGIGEPAVTAAKRVQPNGKVLATDISPEMLAIGRERAEKLELQHVIEFREADAESLKLPDKSFDAVLSRLGLMFLPNLPAATVLLLSHRAGLLESILGSLQRNLTLLICLVYAHVTATLARLLGNLGPLSRLVNEYLDPIQYTLKAEFKGKSGVEGSVPCF